MDSASEFKNAKLFTSLDLASSQPGAKQAKEILETKQDEKPKKYYKKT